jgi:hypothetical protein
MGGDFWSGLLHHLVAMVREGVLSAREIGFARRAETPREAVELVLTSLPDPLVARLVPPDGPRRKNL